MERLEDLDFVDGSCLLAQRWSVSDWNPLLPHLQMTLHMWNGESFRAYIILPPSYVRRNKV